MLIKCTTARHLKAGVAAKEMKVESTVSIEKDSMFLIVIVNGQTQTKELEIKEVICEWKEYMKNGREQYEVVEQGSDGNPHNSIVDMVSENGYTNLTFGSYPDDGSKLQFDVSEYIIETDITTKNLPVKEIKKKKKKGSSKTPLN